MTKYNVHIYREMRLRFDGIEAANPQEAAGKAKELSLKVADDLDEYDGETFAALVDLQDDEAFEKSQTIDFEPQRRLNAFPKLLAALEPDATPSGPDFLDWIADRLVNVYGEPENVDFVLALRRKAASARDAIAVATGKEAA
jgi:hypothetical protein